MIEHGELLEIAEERLKDAEALLAAGRYDGAIYLGGYVVELALKSCICRILNWKGFPQTRSEFQNYQSFRTHISMCSYRCLEQRTELRRASWLNDLP
ncbi:MAG TPA: hypothetical protein DC047_13040 [Blastocatellia bacterium]|nr:hypothetical protein [Blastocatellia bacterium]